MATFSAYTASPPVQCDIDGIPNGSHAEKVRPEPTMATTLASMTVSVSGAKGGYGTRVTNSDCPAGLTVRVHRPPF